MYRRFLALDRGSKGYITSDEFLSIPELSINPIAQRLVRLFHCVNFKEFVKLLSSFSDRATRDQKIESIFYVYDVDGDGECMHEVEVPVRACMRLRCRDGCELCLLVPGGFLRWTMCRPPVRGAGCMTPFKNVGYVCILIIFFRFIVPLKAIEDPPKSTARPSTPIYDNAVFR